MANDVRSWLRPALLVGGCFFVSSFAFGLVMNRPTKVCVESSLWSGPCVLSWPEAMKQASLLAVSIGFVILVGTLFMMLVINGGAEDAEERLRHLPPPPESAGEGSPFSA